MQSLERIEHFKLLNNLKIICISLPSYCYWSKSNAHYSWQKKFYFHYKTFPVIPDLLKMPIQLCLFFSDRNNLKIFHSWEKSTQHGHCNLSPTCFLQWFLFSQPLCDITILNLLVKCIRLHHGYNINDYNEIKC